MSEQAINYSKLTIGEFLTKANSAEPVPGGGSVAALAGALASSMAQMVLNFTIGKEKYKQFDAECKKHLAALEKGQKMMLELIEEDIAAYSQYSEVRKVDKNEPNRNEQMSAAVAACIAVPQEICAVALVMLEDMDAIKDKANVYLLSDLGVAAVLGEATVRAAAYNVRANLSMVKDAGEVGKLKEQIEHDTKRAGRLLESIDRFLSSKF